MLLERHSREYVLARIRAGVLEHGFAALMREAQCGERMDREGEIHDGFLISDQGALQRVDLHQYSGGSSVVVYGQTELTRDLYDARDRMNGQVIHNAEDVQPHDLASPSPYVTYRAGDDIVRIACDYVIGADGFHGVSRKSIPKDVLKEYEKLYPFGWLGVLSRTKPVSPELIYARHERGFALCSLRSQVLSRYYIQVGQVEIPSRAYVSQFGFLACCNQGSRRKGVTQRGEGVRRLALGPQRLFHDASSTTRNLGVFGEVNRGPGNSPADPLVGLTAAAVVHVREEDARGTLAQRDEPLLQP